MRRLSAGLHSPNAIADMCASGRCRCNCNVRLARPAGGARFVAGGESAGECCVMTTTRADLIIVGAGLAGSAAAWAASARGLDVTVLEAFEPGHHRGSSHGSARIFRRAYHDPLYVTMTGHAGEAWQRLQEAAGEQLLLLTGGLDAGSGRDPAALQAVLAACG